MKRFNSMNMTIKPSLLAGAIALAMASGPLSAEVYNLCAVAGNKAMPDGSLVPVWGYAQDIGAGCPATPDIPGPALVVTDGTLTINLTNNLPEPTSIVVTGQALPTSSASGPTWNDGTTGPRGTDLTKKVRSYGVEAAANGGTESYAWTVERSGTFMYRSGTMPQKQVYMGLYGKVTQDAVASTTTTPAEVYPGVAYDKQVSLLYSDIDPVLNASIACLYDADGILDNGLICGTDVVPYTTSIEIHPTWFLVNGEPYQTGMAPIATDDDGITPLVAGDNILVRFLSAASEKHVLLFQGLYGDIHGEDGFQYSWQTGSVEGGKSPRTQYSVGLTPLKTKDVIINPQVDGSYAVYDGNGYMTNPSDPADETVGDTLGGMLRFLQVGAAPNTPPVANADTATVQVNTPVVIDVLANDTDADGDPLTISGVSIATLGSVSTDGSTVTYTAGATAGIDPFTYDISDGNGGTATGTVTVTVIDVNQAPVAVDDAYPVDEDITLSVPAPGVLGNDTDAELDPLTAVLVSGTANGSLTLSADGSFTYTPNANFNGTDSFTYTANDATGVSNTATVAITVNPVNDAPVIDSTPVTTANQDVPYTYDVNASDVDLLDVLTYSLDLAPAGMTIDSVSGLISWTPGATDVGDNSVTVRVTDLAGAFATQTFVVSVIETNTAPTANNDTYTTDEDVILVVVPSGVLANDTDGQGDPLTASIVTNPLNGTVVLNPDGSFSYTSNLNYNGSDEFTYVANDGQLDSNVATVSVTINPVNDPPVAVADTASVPKGNGESVTIPVLDNDTDPDGIGDIDPSTVQVISPPSGATTTVNPDGTITLTLTSGNSVMRVFTYQFKDLSGAVSNEAAVYVTVTK